MPGADGRAAVSEHVEQREAHGVGFRPSDERPARPGGRFGEGGVRVPPQLAGSGAEAEAPGTPGGGEIGGERGG